MKLKLKFAKPEPRKREKAREEREEARLVKQVRASCVERDGHCRLFIIVASFPTCALGECSGPSEWAHLAGHRRFETVGKSPKERHDTSWTAMLCKGHHNAYDAHDFELEQVDARGADGPLRVVVGTRKYEEIE